MTDQTPPDPHSTRMNGTLGDAVHHAISAIAPEPVGDFGIARIVPTGTEVKVIDERDYEDTPRFVKHLESIVGVPSLAQYIAAHAQPDTRVYLVDVYGRGGQMLTADTTLATVHLDDYAAGGVELDPTLRRHAAQLVLRPTAAARRWGAAFASRQFDQEQFLDLVVDGIAEIARPDGSVLRELISDLHAIRTAEVSSVIRTGGNGAIQVAENVKLSAGTGDRVEFPENMVIVLQPFAGVGATITLTVQIKPKVIDHQVMFTLSAPEIDDQLAAVVSDIAADIEERTTYRPIWVA